MRSTPQSTLLARLHHTCSDAAEFIKEAIIGNNAGTGKASRILGDIVSLDTAISYAAMEDRAVRRRVGVLRRIIVSTMNAVSSAQALGDHLLRYDACGTMRARLEQAAAVLGRVKPDNGSATADDLDMLHGNMASDNGKPADPESFFIATRLSDAIRALADSLRATETFFLNLADRESVKLSIHRDYDAARINAMRAFIAVICAGSFWFASAWSNGQSFTRIVAVVCALYATRDNPVIGSRAFFKGALVAGFIAGIFHLFVLPGIDGFPLLAMVLAPFLIAGGIFMLRPKTAGIAAAFNIFFISLLGISNSSRMGFDTFLNAFLALVLGVGISMVVFMVLFPVNAARRRFNIQRAALRDIARLAGGNRMTEDEWCSRMADRMALLAASSPPGDAAKLMSRTLAAVEIGIQTIRLQKIASSTSLPAEHRAVLAGSLAAIGHIADLGIITRLDLIGHLDMPPILRSWTQPLRPLDSRGLRGTLSANAASMLAALESPAASGLTESQVFQLRLAIASQREITGILNLHYLDPDREKEINPKRPANLEVPA